MSALQVYVEGVGLWSPGLGDFAALRAQLEGTPVEALANRPRADMLPPNERRRAPESVSPAS